MLVCLASGSITLRFLSFSADTCQKISILTPNMDVHPLFKKKKMDW